MTQFDQLGLIDPIYRAVADKGYETPTPIQRQAIPKVLQRKDVLGIAQTGTGKTAAFSIPIIQLIHQIDGAPRHGKKLRALILTPTRELAIQIEENIRDYNRYTKLGHAVIFGGVKQGRQVEQLKRGVQILVATPGRLIDLMDQGIISLDDLKIFVLDEADRMLDMGFIHDIKRITKRLPSKRQTLFFSATMPDNILQLSQNLLHNPVRVEVETRSKPADHVRQLMYRTDKSKKIDLLQYILKEEQIETALIFTRTKYGADKLVRKLKKTDYRAAAIHGNKSQNQRQAALKGFKAGKIDLLIATDIAARGIDIKQLGHVINYNVPNISETYVHRIGRSGRAGESGTSITIVQGDEWPYIKDIEKLMKKRIELIKDHPYPQTEQTEVKETKKSSKPQAKGRNHGKKKSSHRWRSKKKVAQS